MRLVFRADGSDQIGSGHVIRCRTLASVLRARGHIVRFICAELSGNLIGLLRADGFETLVLPYTDNEVADALACQTLLAGERPDWLVVDHYGLGEAWHRAMQGRGRIMVVDDLANRQLLADIMLDQNLVAGFERRYDGLVGTDCLKLLGPSFALLRPEFAELRQASLLRRHGGVLSNLLIFMGGGNVHDETIVAIEGVRSSSIVWRRVDVVVGVGCADIDEIKGQIAGMAGWSLHVQTPDFARLLAGADLAITAGGSVSWEKCLLGVPSLVVVLADNQAPIAAALSAAGAQYTLGRADQVTLSDYARALNGLTWEALEAMSQAAAAISDGRGSERVAEALESRAKV